MGAGVGYKWVMYIPIPKHGAVLYFLLR